jgi:hypothetical protein
MRRILPSALVLFALLAQSASARDPIVPLQDVHRGMTCTARTVVHGTDISSFDVEVLDVVSDLDGTGARILVQVSGPVVARTGVAQGFSGSPVFCRGRDGTIGNAGAISATIGQYGNDVALVTPIEQMLNMPVQPPSGVRKAPALLRAAKPLASPLVVSGLAPSLGRLLERAAREHDRALVAVPAGPLATFAPQPLVPGASLAVGLSSGAVAASAVGTVTYRDGDTVYGFGHPLDGAGLRALLLQDAYVFTVVDNPLGIGEVSSYKLAAPGHTPGTLTNDAPAGVVGTVGAAPQTVPLDVRVRDLDRGVTVHQHTELVDEIDLGDPNGQNLFATIAAAAVAQGVEAAFDGAPAQETGHFCLTTYVRELRRPLRFCNRYVTDGIVAPEFLPLPLALTMGGAVEGALLPLQEARFAALHITRIEASATVERGLRLATIRSARVTPRVVRPGRRIRVALRVRMLRGPLRTVRFTTRVPRGLPPGPRTLAITGTPVGDGFGEGLFEFFGEESSGGAQTMADVVARYRSNRTFDGVYARAGRKMWRAYRHPELRIDGRAKVEIVVAGRRRGGDGLPPELRRLLDELS